MIEYKDRGNGSHEISINLRSLKIAALLIAFVFCALGVVGAWR